MIERPANGSMPQVDKIVIHLQSEVVKGYLECDGRSTPLENLHVRCSEACPASVSIRLEDGSVHSVRVSASKTVCFVKQFEETLHRKEVHFYNSPLTMGAIWVRIKLVDGETMEGIVANSSAHLMGPGFFLRPVDPRSNNILVYVAKQWLESFEVLGLRDA
jgi:hypothetical protein